MSDTDKLARIEAREVGTGPRFLTLWEQSALVEIAKAARWMVGNSVIYGDEVHSVLPDYQALDAALSAVDGEQAEAIAQWEQAGLCWRCGHGIDAHGDGGCDWEIRDYGDGGCLDCGCTEYLA